VCGYNVVDLENPEDDHRENCEPIPKYAIMLEEMNEKCARS